MDGASSPRSATTAVDAGVGSYRPGLDGVRAIAVALVILFHLDRLDGGFLGVDAFFVVSGWLITWKLLDEADRDDAVALRRFWSARLRRLAPASLVVLGSIAIVWPLAGIEVASLRRDLVWATGWASNWGTITGGGDYWARFGEPSPVSHFWSLAIEEQFYLVWPLLVAAAVKSGGSHRVVVAVMASLGVGGSIVAMNAMFDPADVTATYMNTFARAHSLLIGAAVAGFTTVRSDGGLRGGAIARRGAPVALVVVIAILATASERAEWMFAWGFPVFALAAVVLVVAAADGAGERILASGPVRWVGDRSYGIYLWHWPIFLLLAPDRLGVGDSMLARLSHDAVRVALAVLAADLSFRFVETPIRSRRRLITWRAPAMAGAAAVVVVTLALVVAPAPQAFVESSTVTLAPAPDGATASSAARHGDRDAAPTRPGSPDRTGPTSTPDRDVDPDPVAVAAASPETTAGTASPDLAEDRAVTPTPTPTPTPNPTPTSSVAPTTSVPAEPPPPPLRVLVTGDSTGAQLAEQLIDHASDVPERLAVASGAWAGCGLSASNDGRLHEFTTAEGDRDVVDLGACRELWDGVPDRVVAEAIDVVVVNIGPWDTVDIRLANGPVVSVADPVGRQLVADAYADFVQSVRSVGATVMWVVPADTHLGWGNVDDPLNDPARWATMRTIIDGLDVVPVDLHGWLIETDRAGPEGRPDGVHLAPSLRERFVAELLDPALEDLRRRPS